MDLVVDANVLFAVLIAKGNTELLFFHPGLRIFAPKFLFEEFRKYHSYISVRTRRSEDDFLRLVKIIERRVILVDRSQTRTYNRIVANACPDPGDIEYFALAFKLGCMLWSNDRALQRQNVVRVITTSELLKLLTSGPE